MVTMHRTPGWKVSVYGREHGAPLFHIEGPDFRRSVAILTLQLIVGATPPAALRLATGWAAENQAALMAKGRELNG
jgi:hypothetical protein